MKNNTITANFIVAPAGASAAAKARADLVCDGINDEEELLASIQAAGKYAVNVDNIPNVQNAVECYAAHSVVWLAGHYHLGSSLVIPDAADMVIQAEGSYLHYEKTTRNAVQVTGMNRCRYYFGTIESFSSDAALCIKPNTTMPALMSQVTFMGLLGHDQKGYGLCLDTTDENVCTNRFEGTDINGFDKGIFVRSAGNPRPPARMTGKCDTNWFWASYIRMCHTCVEEMGDTPTGRVDDNVWEVNVDACMPGAVAVRTAAVFGKWYIIMGGLPGKSKAVILDPGAKHNVLEVHPPLEELKLDLEDNSGNQTNVVLSTLHPPYLRRP